jgi:molecular chaperone DnaK
MSDVIVGIDLGTTNSEIAILEDGKPVVLPDESGDPILPSFVGLSEAGKLLVGKSARNQYPLAPERSIKSIKRKMGTDETVRLGDRGYRPQEISAFILRALKERAEAHLKAPVTKAVITVPAYFNDDQRRATREAGEIAGLEVVRILNEPTAASLTYETGTKDRTRVLVYDLGGGTFDVSIVQIESGVIEVLASHGDTHLGGDDFDDLLLKHVLLKFQEQHGVDLSTNVVARGRLLRAVEEAKKHLSSHPFARIDEEFLAEKDGNALHLSLEMSRSDLEEMIRPALTRTLESLRRALDDAKLKPAEIDRVVLVGGSTRTPLVAHLLEEQLGQPAHGEVNPDLCVAMGAAIQAGLIAGMEVGAVLVDITPHSLGIKSLAPFRGFGQPYIFSRILDRNTPLPCSRSEVFETVQDRQDRVNIEVYQGENDDVRFNHMLGEFAIEGLAKVPAGNLVTVQFDLNLDGILKVSAREKATGLVKNVTIDNALRPFEADQMRASQDRIGELWEDAFPLGGDDDETVPVNVVPELVSSPPEGQRETVQARALIEKAERMLTDMTTEDQADVSKLMQEIRHALVDRNWDTVSAGTNQLSDLLFYLEDA